MNSLQERVNQAFRNANKATISAPTLTKDQWLQEAWPELQKPQLTHLSQLKRQLVNPRDDAPLEPDNPEDDAPPPLDMEDVRPRRYRRRNVYNEETDRNGRPRGGDRNRNRDDEDDFGRGPGNVSD